MNKRNFYFGGLLVATLALGGCANDDTANNSSEGEVPAGTTVFSDAEPGSRTSAKYTGSGLDFYWTTSDKIWVKDDNGDYKQSTGDDIGARIAAVPGSTGTDKAKFWVGGAFTGATAKVRYTGKNGAKDKVTIKAIQTQTAANDAAHIAEDGDFGVATAYKSGSHYNFTLDHKAAYITFMPYTTQNVVSEAIIQKIRVFTGNASDALAGTFDVDDHGALSNATATSNSVELNLPYLPIPAAPTPATNAVTMVVNPGTYTNLSVEYTLYDPETLAMGTIVKTYPSVTFDAGANTPAKVDLQVRVYEADGYYEWDAPDHYWKGFEWNNPTESLRKQPTKNNEQNSAYAPQSTEDVSAHTSRDFNDVHGYDDPTGTAPAVLPGTARFQSLPNVNQLIWYVKGGEPYFDRSTMWATMGHLYVGGMWIKKLKKIGAAQTPAKTVAQMAAAAPDGIDYTRSTINATAISDAFTNITTGKPADTSDYFYLPALGSYGNGGFYAIGLYGSYWSSTPYWAPTLLKEHAYLLQSSFAYLRLGVGSRAAGLRLFTVGNEDEYHPL